MLRIRHLKNKYQKRLIRPLYAQTQATPYAAVLDASLRDAVTQDWTLPGAAFKHKGGLVPGTVMYNKGENVTVGTLSATARPFGLLANFVGGELDDLGDENFVGVWRGPDSVFEILAPGFNDTNLSTAWTASTQGAPVPLYCGTNGLLSAAGADPLGTNGAVTTNFVVAHLIERPSANRIVVDLRV